MINKGSTGYRISITAMVSAEIQKPKQKVQTLGGIQRARYSS